MTNLEMQVEQLYKVGFYTSEASARYFEEHGKRIGKIGAFWGVYNDELYPMTHQQARTFRNNMPNPYNFFLYEVEPE